MDKFLHWFVRPFKTHDKKYHSSSKAEITWMDKGKIPCWNQFARDFTRIQRKFSKVLCQCVSWCWRFLVRAIRVSDRKVLKCAFSLVAIEPKQFEELWKPLLNRHRRRLCYRGMGQETVAGFPHFPSRCM